MMEKEKLRKADIFSGGIIFLFGLWIVYQAMQMASPGRKGNRIINVVPSSGEVSKVMLP